MRKSILILLTVVVGSIAFLGGRLSHTRNHPQNERESPAPQAEAAFPGATASVLPEPVPATVVAAASTPSNSSLSKWTSEDYAALPWHKQLTTPPSVALARWMEKQAFPTEALIDGPTSDEELRERGARCDRSAQGALVERLRRRGDPNWRNLALEQDPSIFIIELLIREHRQTLFASGEQLLQWAGTAASLGDDRFLSALRGPDYRSAISALDQWQVLSSIQQGMSIPHHRNRLAQSQPPHHTISRSCVYYVGPRPREPWAQDALDAERQLLPRGP